MIWSLLILSDRPGWVSIFSGIDNFTSVETMLHMGDMKKFYLRFLSNLLDTFQPVLTGTYQYYLVVSYFSYNNVVIIVGSEFNNQVVDKLFEMTGIRHSISLEYHPQTNGRVIYSDLQWLKVIYSDLQLFYIFVKIM